MVLSPFCLYVPLTGAPTAEPATAVTEPLLVHDVTAEVPTMVLLSAASNHKNGLPIS